MKYLLLFILILTAPSLYSQGVFVLDSTDIILPILYQFRHDARQHNLYHVEGIIAKNLGGIQIVNLQQMNSLYRHKKPTPLGIVRLKVIPSLFDFKLIQPFIYIQESLINNPESLKWVIYHELGHVLGLEHSDGIMAESHSPGEIITQELLDDYFNKIKNLQPNTHRKKHWNE